MKCLPPLAHVEDVERWWIVNDTIPGRWYLRIVFHVSPTNHFVAARPHSDN